MKTKKTRFLYTNGRDVVVTHSTLQTRKANYQLNGITEFGLAIVKSSKIPGIVIALLGLILIANVNMDFIPNSFFEFLSFPSIYLAPDIHILVGAFIITVGVAWMTLVRKRYALRIVTAEGDKNVILSEHKEYVDQIVMAIRKARLT